VWCDAFFLSSQWFHSDAYTDGSSAPLMKQQACFHENGYSAHCVDNYKIDVTSSHVFLRMSIVFCK